MQGAIEYLKGSIGSVCIVGRRCPTWTPCFAAHGGPCTDRVVCPRRARSRCRHCLRCCVGSGWPGSCLQSPALRRLSASLLPFRPVSGRCGGGGRGFCCGSRTLATCRGGRRHWRACSRTWQKMPPESTSTPLARAYAALVTRLAQCWKTATTRTNGVHPPARVYMSQQPELSGRFVAAMGGLVQTGDIQ